MKLILSVPLLIFLGLGACTPAAVQTVVSSDGSKLPESETPESEVPKSDSAGSPEASVAETATVEKAIEKAAIAHLNSVPPDGLDSLTPEGLRYFQGMGPLEYALRLSGVPNVPTWRVRLRLIPQYTSEPDGFTYLVKVDHYNLSPALYASLVEAYGDNADPSLNNDSPHESFQFSFAPVMSISADWLSELSKFSQLPVTENPSCRTQAQLQLGCATLLDRQLETGEWQKTEPVTAESAPWESNAEPLYAVARMLVQQAGFLKGSGESTFWTDGEIPEGSNEERPWLEVLVDNYPGNGGGYQGLLVKRAADDSISSEVYRVYYDLMDTAETGSISTAVVCSREPAAGEIRTICP